MVNNVNVNLEHVVAYLFALWIPYGLIDTQYQTGCLSSTANCVKLDKTGFPHKCIHVVPDTSYSIDVNTDPFVTVRMVSSAIC